MVRIVFKRMQLVRTQPGMPIVDGKLHCDIIDSLSEVPQYSQSTNEIMNTLVTADCSAAAAHAS
jgi:hypothetical protein